MSPSMLTTRHEPPIDGIRKICTFHIEIYSKYDIIIVTYNKLMTIPFKIAQVRVRCNLNTPREILN
jgi:hypothetical protein